MGEQAPYLAQRFADVDALRQQQERLEISHRILSATADMSKTRHWEGFIRGIDDSCGWCIGAMTQRNVSDELRREYAAEYRVYNKLRGTSEMVAQELARVEAGLKDIAERIEVAQRGLPQEGGQQDAR